MNVNELFFMLFILCEGVFLIWFLPILIKSLGPNFPKYSIEKDGKIVVSLFTIIGHMATGILIKDIISNLGIINSKFSFIILAFNIIVLISYYYLLPFMIKTIKGEEIFWKLDRNIFSNRH